MQTIVNLICRVISYVVSEAEKEEGQGLVEYGCGMVVVSAVVFALLATAVAIVILVLVWTHVIPPIHIGY